MCKAAFVEAVYHGSPHDFSKFSTDKIGSGEGNQSYGWGLYFAGNKDVAEWYRRTLTARHAMNLKSYRMITDLPDRLEREIMKHVNEVWTSALRYRGLTGYWLNNIYTFYNMANDYVPRRDRAYYEEHRDEIEQKIAAFEAKYRDDPDFRARYHEYMGADAKPDWGHLRHPFASAYRAASDELERQLRARGHAGNLYEVEIPTDDEFLLWDNPLSDQPEPVKAAIAQMGQVDPDQTGEAFYHAMIKQAGSPKEASLLLASRGIAGIRYLDGSSRGRGYGHHNYVVFDDTRVSSVTSDGRVEEAQETVGATTVPVLYHGTCRDNAAQLIQHGWQPRSAPVGGNQGQTKYLYLSTDREDALWFAQEKGCDTVVRIINVPRDHLIVDPEDGNADTVEDEMNSPHGLPGKLALIKPLPAQHFEVDIRLREAADDAKHFVSRPWRRRRSAEQWLKRKGFRRLGSGISGSVWTDDRHTVKVFQNDPCYRRYVEFCRANRGDRHLPRVSKVFMFDENCGAVFIERLAPSRDVLQANRMNNFLYDLVRERPMHDVIKRWASENQSLVATLRKIAAAFPDCHADIHKDNIMLRGDTIVITDPITEEE